MREKLTERKTVNTAAENKIRTFRSFVERRQYTEKDLKNSIFYFLNQLSNVFAFKLEKKLF